MTERPTRKEVEKALAWADSYLKIQSIPPNAHGLVLAAECRALEQELDRAKMDHMDAMASLGPWRPRALNAEKALTLAQAELAASKERIEILTEALTTIAFTVWTEVTDGSGPIDCTPKEKGLLGYVGKVHSIARAALDAGRELGEREGK